MITDAQGGIGVDATAPPYAPPIIPDDVYSLDLAGQLIGLPGGENINGTGFVADGTGMNAVYPDPTTNPNPTGGYMTVLADIVKTANQAFNTYVSGSPSVAVPAARRPAALSTRAVPTATVPGANNWLKYGAVAAGAVAILFGLAYFA